MRAGSGRRIHHKSRMDKMNQEEYRKKIEELDSRIIEIHLREEAYKNEIADLRQSCERYRELFLWAPMGMALVDPNGKFVEANRTLSLFIGFDSDYLAGKSLFSFVIPEDQDSAFVHLRNAVKTGKTQACEFALKGKGYRQISVLARMSPFVGRTRRDRLMISLADVTQIKNAEHQLKKKEREIRTLVDNAEDIIVRFDRHLRHVFVNKAVEKLTGLKMDDILGKTYRELKYPQDLCDFWDNKILSVFREKKKRRFEFPLVKAREKKFCESLMVPELDNHGSVKYVLSIVRDVTEKKDAENKILELNRELETKCKELEAANRELEMFTSSVSHDLRAPLRSIKGFSTALLEDYFPVLDKKGKDYLARIRRAVQTTENLIDSLLQLSRLSTARLDIQTLDLSAMARKSAAELKKNHPGRKAEFVIGEGLSAPGDLNLLTIVIQNLLRNAWKFTNQEPVARIEFGLKDQGQKSCFYVRDNGVGFDMAYADKLFQPFQRLHSHSDYPGSGIGLTTVRRILSRHGGEVWAESKPGGGATFYFTLGS